ncbi:hypothetical protein ACHAAC_05280 [Aeromicrobium sp. CF4.19]|uniref:hypothetical protein n=1 Tax=Aeromicrobium sp. CF4.19 TaxID=3373082 RepID=UPI003EE7F62C
MRALVTSAVLHLVGTLAAGLALRAGDATLAVVAVAVTAALLVWFASLHGTEEASGLPLASTASALGLCLTGRSAFGTLLPLAAAQVVGSVAAGGLLLALGRADGTATLVWDTPGLVAIAAAALLVGVVTAWATLAIDGGEHPSWWIAPALLAGAVLNVALVAAIAPAMVLGLATAGLLGWATAGVAAAGVLAGAAGGVYLVAAVTPAAA